MRGIAECKIAGHIFTLRELTYPQVLEQIKAIKEREDEPGGLDWLFGQKYMPRHTMEAIVGEDVETFLVEHELAPSEIEPLYKEAVRINPFLAGALAEMREIGRMMRADAQSIMTGLSRIFDEPPSSSSDGDTTAPSNTAFPTSSKSSTS